MLEPSTRSRSVDPSPVSSGPASSRRCSSRSTCASPSRCSSASCVAAASGRGASAAGGAFVRRLLPRDRDRGAAAPRRQEDRPDPVADARRHLRGGRDHDAGARLSGAVRLRPWPRGLVYIGTYLVVLVVASVVLAVNRGNGTSESSRLHENVEGSRSQRAMIHAPPAHAPDPSLRFHQRPPP